MPMCSGCQHRGCFLTSWLSADAHIRPCRELLMEMSNRFQAERRVAGWNAWQHVCASLRGMWMHASRVILGMAKRARLGIGDGDGSVIVGLPTSDFSQSENPQSTTPITTCSIPQMASNNLHLETWERSSSQSTSHNAQWVGIVAVDLSKSSSWILAWAKGGGLLWDAVPRKSAAGFGKSYNK